MTQGGTQTVTWQMVPHYSWHHWDQQFCPL